MIIELILRSHLSKNTKCDPGNLSHLKNRCHIAEELTMKSFFHSIRTAKEYHSRLIQSCPSLKLIGNVCALLRESNPQPAQKGRTFPSGGRERMIGIADPQAMERRAWVFCRPLISAFFLFEIEYSCPPISIFFWFDAP